MRFDTVYCVEEDVPLPILCESGLDFEAARFITVSAAEANRARLWLAETFVVEQISAAISAYEDQIQQALDILTSFHRTPSALNGGLQ